MIGSFVMEVKESWEAFRKYYHREKNLRWFIAVLILILYGIRLTQGDVFVDSDIMMTSPEGLMFSWYGHRRFGLIVTKKLFQLVRLVPYLANVLFALTLWAVTVGICFCMYEWGGRTENCRKGAFLFAGVFLTAPCFAEQFNFVLQAFEIAAAMVYCVVAVYCAGRWIYDRKGFLWAFLALGFMVWAFASYQAFPAFYMALVLISYIFVFLCQKRECGFWEGILHAGLFIAGFVVYQILAKLICDFVGASSSYVNNMFLWGVESTQTCIDTIVIDAKRIYEGYWPTFFDRRFLYVVIAAVILSLILGWRRKSRKFPCFLLAAALLPVTPLMITLITAMNQPIRGQMTFPLVYAYYVMFLYVGIRMMPVSKKAGRMCRNALCGLAVLFGSVMGWKQGITMCQLWETAHESYVSDALTANRMYADICRAADREDMENCRVVFVGTRKAELAGTPLYGDVIGHSFFEWDASGPEGVSGRVYTFFQTLGLVFQRPVAEEYQAALKFSEKQPVWPANGSVVQMEEDVIVVKLSDYQ